VKILVIRFSSIGDVVLTTPIVRALKQQVPAAEIHFITKKSFKDVLENNPNIDKLYTIEKSISEVLSQLKNEKYDYIIDLHKNTRTLSLKLKLRRPSFTFPKLNFEKWLLVNSKRKAMPNNHVVDRYFKAVEKLGVQNDGKPCDFFIHPSDELEMSANFRLQSKDYISIAIGAQFATKRIPLKKLQEIITLLNQPIILIGGPTDKEFADQIILLFPDKNIQSACGKYTLAQSASIVKQSAVLLTNDTGMMHIASCFEVPTVSVWGNTVPELGMYPYFPLHKELYSIHEVSDLKCRPCSKIGFQECPKKHFNCMNLQDSEVIAKDLLLKGELTL
jgi:ADP-heptose:LPS heptosyltransferase